jgi:hypothetical protein
MTPAQIRAVCFWCLAAALASLSLFLRSANEHRFAFAARFPALLYAAAPVALFAPTAGMYPRARRALTRSLARLVTPWRRRVAFADSFAADVACSLAKSLSDVERAVCTMAAGAERVSRAAAFDEDGPCGSHSWRVPFALALPSLIRLAQCLRAFADTRRKAHLWNALKYASGFPVVFLSYAKYGVAHEAWIGTYRPAWIACAVINAAYSYYWDVTKDWGLTLFSSSRPGGRRRRRAFDGDDDAARSEADGDEAGPSGPAPWGLRERRALLYGSPGWYYLALVSNLLLRASWAYKLSSHLRHNLWTVGLMTALEITRRFAWSMFRVEEAYRDVLDARARGEGGGKRTPLRGA